MRIAVFIVCYLLTTFTIGCAVVQEETPKRLPEFLILSNEPDTRVPKDSTSIQFRIANNELLRIDPGSIYMLAGFGDATFRADLNAQHRHQITLAPGKYVFQFYIHGYEEIYSDLVTLTPGNRMEVNLFFRETRIEIMEEKPVIYLYPPTDLAVEVTVRPRGRFTFTYPEIGDGWKGTAHPNGSITIGATTYPYLFWEASDQLPLSELSVQRGFIISGSESVTFLEKQLSHLGLNDRERTDFITYWGPRMTGNNQLFVRFVLNEACNEMATLTVAPQPDAVYRLFMLWAPVPEGMNLNPLPQELPVFDRSGFHVLEWGGGEMPIHTQLSTR